VVDIRYRRSFVGRNSFPYSKFSKYQSGTDESGQVTAQRISNADSDIYYRLIRKQSILNTMLTDSY